MVTRTLTDETARAISRQLTTGETSEPRARNGLAVVAHKVGAADVLAYDLSLRRSDAEEISAMTREVVTTTILQSVRFDPACFTERSMWGWIWSFTRAVAGRKASAWRAAATWSKTTCVPDDQLDATVTDGPGDPDRTLIAVLEAAALAAHSGRRPACVVADTLARALVTGFDLPEVCRLRPTQRVVARAMLDTDRELARDSLEAVSANRVVPAPLGSLWVGWGPEDAQRALDLDSSAPTLLADAGTLPDPPLGVRGTRRFARRVRELSADPQWRPLAATLASNYLRTATPSGHLDVRAAQNQATKLLAVACEAATFPDHPAGGDVWQVLTGLAAALQEAAPPHEDSDAIIRGQLLDEPAA